MKNSRYDTSPYEKKILELRSLVEAEARKLQDVTEGRDNVIRETRELVERKARLNREIEKLEIKIKEREVNLAETIEKKNTCLSSTKVALVAEKKKLQETTKLLMEVTNKFSEITPVVKELEDFILKESNARERYSAEMTKLEVIRKERGVILAENIKEKQELTEQQNSLEGMRVYVSDLYGKVATYANVAKETIEQVNEILEEKKVPLHFGLPPDEVLEINFDNFNKQYV